MSARVMRFRQGVYANRRNISAGCQVLLLRLADDMDAKCIVSVPRSRLAAELAAPEARITEWIAQAKSTGFLEVARRARPRVTAVYRGLYVPVSEVRPRVPLERYGNPDPSEVRTGVPPNAGPEVRPAGVPSSSTTAAIDTDHAHHLDERGQDERGGVPHAVSRMPARPSPSWLSHTESGASA